MVTTDSKKRTPVVHTAGLCKTFKDFWRRPRVEAVADLNLEVYPGQIFGLLGPNGSGKSTTIKMLLGLLYPTRGRIAVFGRAPTDVAVKSRIGYLPEESYLYRFLDARETLDYYGRLFRLPPQVRRNRTEMLLDMVGLKHEARRRLGEYSKGMARRIGLAQALINDPEFLILDEPTSGLDPIGTRQIKDVIRELGHKGKTILLSSHVLADVEDVCDQISILYGGRQRAAGDVRELLSKQEFTQITTPRLLPETVEELRDLLLRLEQKDIVSVGAPRHRLEEFFHQIVEEAQRANVTTSGARAAGALPEFLKAAATGDDGRALVDSLVEAGVRRPETVVEPMVVAPQPEPGRRLVEELLAAGAPLDGRAEPRPAAATSGPAVPPAPSSPLGPLPPEPAGPRPPVEADRDLIEGLLKKTASRSDGDKAP